ncbi:hypothetical protein N0V83_001965 [Neocucurbitaria cava]|uniref:Protein kinase domain-containing protein n=1 Tax=Neocucurbitaria cava TaxID=798079 RepID=A0A9W9CQC7_9PLEO|nr:hypothetical protein N0V83_001965 [Neocucurbitaria cava]
MLLLEEGKDYDDADDAHLPYKHIKNLGHGHSGVVEEVEDQVTKAVYARKTIWLPASRASKQEQTKVFRNEVKIIRGLGDHRHIIKIFATYMTRRHVGIILQPVASEGDLEGFLAMYWSDVHDMKVTDERNIQLEAMVPIIEQAFGCLAAALAFIHEKKVRHKDVKPKNILIHNGRIIYTDFGYSFDSSALSRSTTDGRPNALTRKYSAPEVIDHDERNSKSDVYSLGCVFIDLLSALTLAMDPDDVRCYSESMLDLHGRLLSWEIPPRHRSLPKVIIGMTTLDPSNRSSAFRAASHILHLPEFCCPECATIAAEFPEEVTEDHEFIETPDLIETGTVQDPTAKDIRASHVPVNEHPATAKLDADTPNDALDTNHLSMLSDLASDKELVSGDFSELTIGDVTPSYVSPASTAYPETMSQSQTQYVWNTEHQRNQATLRRGVRPEEHGIVYTYGRSPELIEGETGITKYSIAVVMAAGEQAFHTTSRIYYGIHHPIQYNVKVRDKGTVLDEHIPALIGNWKEEDDGEGSRQAPEVTAMAEEPDFPEAVGYDPLYHA